MGRLKRHAPEEFFLLRSRCLIGRSSTCDVRFDDARISGEHACVRWTGDGWELRDLASKNGVFVRGHRVAAGERILLAAGDGFTLGDPGASAFRFTLVEAAPPVASALHVASGAVRASTAGLLVLPDDNHPRVSLIEGRNGRWMLEAEGEVRAVEDREIVVVDGEAWSLDLPALTGPTLDGEAAAQPEGRPLIDSIGLRFHVSRDEERVEITILHRSGELHLPARSHHYLLLTLARARLADAGAPPAQQGWRDRDELCRMLATDESRLNVDVCRARKQFLAAGVHGAANLVERRPGTGRIRLGVGRVEIERV
ncbi:FHA domain-containing protein [Sorangium sp. So ce131]|uniref:FHA domain-containing protein n=1 Tax=Sorangium sp. So ce131 TaxID=3133282 RepID=UPI003F6123B9